MSDERRHCPDDGVCGHYCDVGCWRVTGAGPLSGVYPDDKWPESVTSAQEEIVRLQEDRSALLDEIFGLRIMLAYEAEGMKTTLEYKTFPKSRRAVTEKQIERMMNVASGKRSGFFTKEEYPMGSRRRMKEIVGIVVAGNWRNGWREVTRSE